METPSKVPSSGSDVVGLLLSGQTVSTNNLAEYLLLKLYCPELQVVDAVKEPISEAVKTEQPALAFTYDRIRLTFRLDAPRVRDRLKDTDQSPEENLKWHLAQAQATANSLFSLSVGHALHSRELEAIAKEQKAIEKLLNGKLPRK